MSEAQPPSPARVSGRIVGNPAWRLVDDDGYLVVTAGADEVWVVDDVPGSIASELARCWTPNPPHSAELSGQAARAVEQLRALGAVGPDVALPPQPRLGLAWCGEPVDALDAALRRAWPTWTTPRHPPDLLVVVRTTGTLHSLADAAPAWVRTGVVHLLADLAAEHTIALGPLVVPGHTACVGCAAGRIAARWGDPPPPAQPLATSAAPVLTVAGLIVHQLGRVLAGHYDLVDRVVSLDLDSLALTSSPCLRASACPSCGGVASDGRLELPWSTR